VCVCVWGGGGQIKGCALKCGATASESKKILQRCKKIDATTVVQNAQDVAGWAKVSSESVHVQSRRGCLLAQ
jgi:hypothetical protein